MKVTSASAATERAQLSGHEYHGRRAPPLGYVVPEYLILPKARFLRSETMYLRNFFGFPRV